MSTDTARLIAVEEALAHQAATIDLLDGIIRDQANRIDRLEARVKRLTERAAEAESSAGGSHVFSDAPPPHY